VPGRLVGCSKTPLEREKLTDEPLDFRVEQN
jgi:hypothetical protein